MAKLKGCFLPNQLGQARFPVIFIFVLDSALLSTVTFYPVTPVIGGLRVKESFPAFWELVSVLENGKGFSRGTARKRNSGTGQEQGYTLSAKSEQKDVG